MRFPLRKIKLLSQHFRKNVTFAASKFVQTMYTFCHKHKKRLTLLLNLLFWLIICFFFIRFTLFRPICDNHIYKEFICVFLIMSVVYVTRCLFVPKLYLRGRYGMFWAVSVCMLLMAALIEILLVKQDIEHKIYSALSANTYFLYIYGRIVARDSFFFAWFLLLSLYTQQRDAFQAKQRASVMEHRAVQFSLPDRTEASIPIDLILYIQETGHDTQVHCTNGDTITVSNPLSYCEEMIPATLWTFDGKDKMVFHQHLSEYFTVQPNQEVLEIKTIVPLSQRQFQIFDFIRQHPNCTAPFIKENMSGKHSLRTIEREIAILRERGVVSHTGSSKGGGYEVVNHNVVSLE